MLPTFIVNRAPEATDVINQELRHQLKIISAKALAKILAEKYHSMEESDKKNMIREMLDDAAYSGLHHFLEEYFSEDVQRALGFHFNPGTLSRYLSHEAFIVQLRADINDSTTP